MQPVNRLFLSGVITKQKRTKLIRYYVLIVGSIYIIYCLLCPSVRRYGLLVYLAYFDTYKCALLLHTYIFILFILLLINHL